MGCRHAGVLQGFQQCGRKKGASSHHPPNHHVHVVHLEQIISKWVCQPPPSYESAGGAMDQPCFLSWVQVVVLLTLAICFWGFSVAWKSILSFLGGTEMPWGQEWDGRERDSSLYE